MREVIPMDNMHRRRQYTRYSRQNRNKKQSGKGKDDFVKSVFNQVIVCGVILLLVFAVKNIDTDFTNKITQQVRDMLGYTVEIGDAYDTVETFAENSGILTSSKSKTEGDQQQQQNEMHDEKTKGELSFSDKESTEESQQVAYQQVAIRQEMMTPLNGTVMSLFGMRKHPLFHGEFFHSGIDIEANQGEEFVAAMDGEVVEIGKDKSYGNYIKIKHNDDIYTFYAHCNQIFVEKGQQVHKGQRIGNIGQGEQILGAHLHFEIRKNDKMLDPLKYLDLPIHETIRE